MEAGLGVYVASPQSQDALGCADVVAASWVPQVSPDGRSTVPHGFSRLHSTITAAGGRDRRYLNALDPPRRPYGQRTIIMSVTSPILSMAYSVGYDSHGTEPFH